MSEEKTEKSTSILRRTVKNIKRNVRAKSFISIQQEKALKLQKQLTADDRKTADRKNGLAGRGVVFLSHVPPGFYEDELKEYFTQFGEVTNVRLERSEKTGRIKGYAWIEFEFAEVAKIAAETMNNYIIFNRILKARYQPRIKGDFFKKSFNITNYPKLRRTLRNTKSVNKKCTQSQARRRVRKRLKNLEGIIQRLKDKGIDYSYKPAISKEIPNSLGPGRYIRINEPGVSNISSEKSLDSKAILEIDESDDEIAFMTPPNVVKKKLSISENLVTEEPLRKLDTSKQGKVKSRKISQREHVATNNDEIAFMTPPNVVKKKLSISKNLVTEEPLRKLDTSKQGKVKSRKRRQREHVATNNDEIAFMTPPNVVKKKLSISKNLVIEEPLRKLDTSKQGKVMSRKRRQRKHMATNNEVPESMISLAEKMTTVMPDKTSRNNRSGSQKFSGNLKEISREKRLKNMKLKQDVETE